MKKAILFFFISIAIFNSCKKDDSNPVSPTQDGNSNTPINPSNNWTPTNGPSNSCVYSFGRSGSKLFAGADYGTIFLSTDNGTTWTKPVKNELGEAVMIPVLMPLFLVAIKSLRLFLLRVLAVFQYLPTMESIGRQLIQGCRALL